MSKGMLQVDVSRNRGINGDEQFYQSSLGDIEMNSTFVESLELDTDDEVPLAEKIVARLDVILEATGSTHYVKMKSGTAGRANVKDTFPFLKKSIKKWIYLQWVHLPYHEWAIVLLDEKLPNPAAINNYQKLMETYFDGGKRPQNTTRTENFDLHTSSINSKLQMKYIHLRKLLSTAMYIYIHEISEVCLHTEPTSCLRVYRGLQVLQFSFVHPPTSTHELSTSNESPQSILTNNSPIHKQSRFSFQSHDSDTLQMHTNQHNTSEHDTKNKNRSSFLNFFSSSHSPHKSTAHETSYDQFDKSLSISPQSHVDLDFSKITARWADTLYWLMEWLSEIHSTEMDDMLVKFYKMKRSNSSMAPNSRPNSSSILYQPWLDQIKEISAKHHGRLNKDQNSQSNQDEEDMKSETNDKNNPLAEEDIPPDKNGLQSELPKVPVFTSAKPSSRPHTRKTFSLFTTNSKVTRKLSFINPFTRKKSIGPNLPIESSNFDNSEEKRMFDNPIPNIITPIQDKALQISFSSMQKQRDSRRLSQVFPPSPTSSAFVEKTNSIKLFPEILDDSHDDESSALYDTTIQSGNNPTESNNQDDSETKTIGTIASIGRISSQPESNSVKKANNPIECAEKSIHQLGRHTMIDTILQISKDCEAHSLSQKSTSHGDQTFERNEPFYSRIEMKNGIRSSSQKHHSVKWNDDNNRYFDDIDSVYPHQASSFIQKMSPALRKEVNHPTSYVTKDLPESQVNPYQLFSKESSSKLDNKFQEIHTRNFKVDLEDEIALPPDSRRRRSLIEMKPKLLLMNPSESTTIQSTKEMTPTDMKLNTGVSEQTMLMTPLDTDSIALTPSTLHNSSNPSNPHTPQTPFTTPPGSKKYLFDSIKRMNSLKDQLLNSRDDRIESFPLLSPNEVYQSNPMKLNRKTISPSTNQFNATDNLYEIPGSRINMHEVNNPKGLILIKLLAYHPTNNLKNKQSVVFCIKYEQSNEAVVIPLSDIVKIEWTNYFMKSPRIGICILQRRDNNNLSEQINHFSKKDIHQISQLKVDNEVNPTFKTHRTSQILQKSSSRRNQSSIVIDSFSPQSANDDDDLNVVSFDVIYKQQKSPKIEASWMQNKMEGTAQSTRSAQHSLLERNDLLYEGINGEMIMIDHKKCIRLLFSVGDQNMLKESNLDDRVTDRLTDTTSQSRQWLELMQQQHSLFSLQ